MKVFGTIIGIILIVLGILAVSYQGISYTQREKIAQFGELQVSADTQKVIYLPPVLGGFLVVAGVVILIVNRRK